MTTVVWFKRDLRTRDHAPLVAAASLGEPVIPLYVIVAEHAFDVLPGLKRSKSVV